MEYTDQDIITFGKYFGQQLGKVPPSYLLYLHERRMCFGAMRRYITANLEALKAKAAATK